MRTQSEQWFEVFCARTGLICRRIAEEDEKTPDYQLEIDDQIIIVEVKEIIRNQVEQKADQLLKKHVYTTLSNTPGDRVRKKITDSSAQIKAKTQGIHPSILVLCDIKDGSGQITGHTTPDNIRVGMYGLEQIHIAVPKDITAIPYATGMSYGPKKKMTENQNTSISAIGVLSTPEEDDIRLDLYHNIHAAQRLDRTLISKYGIPQFHLVKQGQSTTAQWKKI